MNLHPLQIDNVEEMDPLHRSPPEITTATTSSRNHRKVRYYRFCGIAVIATICLPLLLIWRMKLSSIGYTTKNTRTSSNNQLLFQNLLHNRSTCQKTKVFPFRVGCPKRCLRAMNDTEPMYRMSMAWYLGMPDMEEGTAYERGINYQCPIEFVNNYRYATKQMNAIQNLRDVQIKYQPRMHLSLNYLCCLRKNETDWVREIMYQWILDNYPFKISIQFNQFQCWHERLNSVTNIIILAEPSQYALIKMSNDIENKLLQKGIPTEVHRSDQMPFHVTLLGIYRGTTDEDIANNISDDIPFIFDIVSNISSQIGSKWTGNNRMIIRHAPKMSNDPVLHAGVDNSLPP